jgi:hypothetical protein
MIPEPSREDINRMADSESDLKSLEMRVAELEDKLSKIYITEEEFKAYQKVASLMGANSAIQAVDPPTCVPPGVCSVCSCPCGPKRRQVERAGTFDKFGT